MLKITRYLKKFRIHIVIIIGLLILQAYSDLALPSYTSNIVDVGIQQGGIESSVPKVMRESKLDGMLSLLDENEAKSVREAYDLIKKEELTEKEYSEYVNKYPVLSEENIYIMNDDSKIESLTSIFEKNLLIMNLLDGDSDEARNMKEQLSAQMPAEMNNYSLLEIVTMMPDNQKETILDNINEQINQMPESIQAQAAKAAIKEEYNAIGIDISQLQTRYILITGLKMLGLALVAMAATIGVGFLSARVAAGFGKRVRLTLFEKVIGFSNMEFDNFSTASLITRSTNDIQQVEMSIGMILRMVIYAPILAAGGIIKVLNTNTSMAWIIVIGVALLALLMGSLLIVAMPKFKMLQKRVDRLNLVTREILTGLSVIRAFNKEKHEEGRFEVANRDLMKTNLFVNRTMAFMMPAMTLIMNGITLLILWKGAEGINLGTMQVGDMMAFIQYTMQIIMSFLMLSMLSFILPRASVSAARIIEVIDTELSIQDPVTSAEFSNDKKGYITFNHVSFRYPNADDDVLSDITFTAKPGETTAFIGSTGSGKSTLINLIPRFFDVTSGSIEVGGVDVRKVKLHDLREKIGYVPQKGVLFSGTIDSNIRYGKEDASKDLITKAASIAQATDFIEAKDDKYDTPISQGGTNVSGGQRQRLSIARAIAKEPDIYIFDDSFSALDYKTDITLRKALKTEISDSTVLIVAQRISTILHADQIIVLDDGKIVGKGTHNELIKNCEEYKQIALSQLSKEELAYE